MPETSFPSAQQIATTEIDTDSPITEPLLTKFRDRDVTLIDQMAKHGGPSSVGAGSDISYEGDVVIAANQSLGGMHNYNNLMINSGVVVTVDRYVIIMAKGTVTIAGTMDGTGQGPLGGAAVSTGVTGLPGQDGAGGGSGGAGGGSSAYAGGAGGKGGVFGDLVAGGAGAVDTIGGAGTAISLRTKGAALLARLLFGGGGGGSGAGSGTNASGAGGKGGAGIIIIAPIIILTGGSLVANGAAGESVGGSEGSGGGGGGGVIYLATKSFTGTTPGQPAGGAAGTEPSGAGRAGGAAGAGLVQIDIYS